MLFYSFFVLFTGGILTWQHLKVSKEKAKLPEEIILDETANMKIYRNEEYGLEFLYLRDWGEIELKSQKNDVYEFASPNKLILEIKYHKPSKYLAFITKGKIHREAKEPAGEYPMPDEVEVCDYVLKVIDQEGKIKNVYTKENSPEIIDGQLVYPYFGGFRITNINFSPNGKYIALNLYGYEPESY